MNDSLGNRWHRARLGEVKVDADGIRTVEVHVECGGDPREEVIEALEMLGYESKVKKKKAAK